MIVIRFQRNRSPWQAIAGFACILGAILSILFGSLLTTGWVLNAAIHPVLHALGLTLLIVAIPILILGGHCFDLLEKTKERTRQSGGHF
jgi:hypothetical protein